MSNIFIYLLLSALIFYPIISGISFLVSGFYYHFFLEKQDRPSYLKGGIPFVTIFVPAHNEEEVIGKTISYLETKMNYPTNKYEILVIDDNSIDKTSNILKKLQSQFKNLRIITIKNNKGKAHGYNIALAFAKGEYILSNDADTQPEPDAIWKYISYFQRKDGKNLGAVTGNMLPANRTTIIALAQENELNSIIGLIKRSQASYGGLFAFSGANTMYKKQAVIDVGGWQPEQPTEDIAISWDMQINGWSAKFAPNIRFFLDVPENLSNFVKQRYRWSSGGIYVLLTKSFSIFKHPLRNVSLIPIVIDYFASIIWSFFYWISIVYFIVIQGMSFYSQNWDLFFRNLDVASIFVAIEVIIGVLQLIIASVFNDGGKTIKYVLFAPWYVLIYWMVNTYTIVAMFIPTLIKVISGSEGGTWKSPNRSKSLNKK